MTTTQAIEPDEEWIISRIIEIVIDPATSHRDCLDALDLLSRWRGFQAFINRGFRF